MTLYWRRFNNEKTENDSYKFSLNRYISSLKASLIMLRTKVLECLMACFSAPILYPAASIERAGDPWIHFCVSPYNDMLGNALVSMLNYGISYEENGMVIE